MNDDELVNLFTPYGNIITKNILKVSISYLNRFTRDDNFLRQDQGKKDILKCFLLRIKVHEVKLQCLVGLNTKDFPRGGHDYINADFF